MEARHRNAALLAGIVSGFLFALAISGAAAGLLMVYTPFIPLLAIGLIYGAKAGLIAVAIGALTAGVAGHVNGFVSFSMLVAIPAAFFLHQALEKEGRYRPSVGRILTGLSYYGVIIASFAVVAISAMEGGFAALVPAAVEGESQLMAMTRETVTKQPFLIIGMSVWVQILIFYGVAVLVNYILAGWNLTQRESLAIRPFMPSAWLLLALLGSGLLSFSSETATSLSGKTAFIILLFPYFLMGISKLHVKTKHWKNRTVMLTFMYFFLSLIPYLMFAFIGSGLLAQGRYLSNRFHASNDNGTGSNE